MLPSKGYFNDIECPYLENSCGRPFCHFNHRKKQQESKNEVVTEEYSSQDVPTYKPTPKCELAVRKSHIPISYVPDVYKVEKSTPRSFRNNTLSDIVYKPTPISLLNSAVKNSANNSNNIQNNILDSKYVPETTGKGIARNEKILKDNEDELEYEPKEHKLEYQYNPSSHKEVNEANLSDIVYRPNSSCITNITNVEYTPSACSNKNSTLNFENLDNEFEMIDEIINTSQVSRISENVDEIINLIPLEESNSAYANKNISSASNSEAERPFENKDKFQQNSTRDRLKSITEESGSHSLKSSKKIRKCYDGDKSTDKKENTKKDCTKQDKSAEKRNYKEDRREKCETKAKDNKIDENRKNEYNKNTVKEKKDIKNESDNVKKEKSDNVKKNSYDKSKCKKTEDDKKNRRSRSHSSHRDRDKSKHSKHKSEKQEHERKYDKRHTKHDDKKKKETSDSELEKIDNDNKNIKHKKKESEYSYLELDSSDAVQDTNKESPSIDLDYDIDVDIDEKQTMEECFRIFNEDESKVAQSINSEILSYKNDNELVEESVVIKKRIAHSNASSSSMKFQQPKPIAKPTPGQIMANRFKIIKAAQADNEMKLITNELKNITKRPPPSQIFKPEKKYKLSATKSVVTTSTSSLIDDIINRSNTKPSFKKIAPVSNVINIQKAKANLMINNKQATERINKTIAQTNKAGKREAHVPDYSLSDIPDVIDVDKSKLPVNVRSRFLTLLADECCKLYLTQKDAYKRALDEEYSCYQKCKVLVTYRNSAMLAVNRLRKEIKERDQKNLGLIGSDESSEAKKDDVEKRALYDRIHQYVLTNEELIIHGYPRESDIPGRAVIKNRKTSNIIPLPKNQKKCCRCSKIYLIDEDGKAVYEEECIYHPLRKRTLRGEQIYLCCKTSDDSGCVTSHTHVCEMPEDAELEGFQSTLPPNDDSDPRSNTIYALDCEMCYTTKGLELTRVTVIDTNCKTVYESLVKPSNEILDYNTRFSGITKQQMDRTSTGILQVQANILHLCNSKTILIGHSLESDMKALKIIHSTIVDTAVLFPHKMGLPHKRALRTLASEYLKKIIQNDVGGHDSAEDAITCMELLKWKIKEDTKFRS